MKWPCALHTHICMQRYQEGRVEALEARAVEGQQVDSGTPFTISVQRILREHFCPTTHLMPIVVNVVLQRTYLSPARSYSTGVLTWGGAPHRAGGAAREAGGVGDGDKIVLVVAGGGGHVSGGTNQSCIPVNLVVGCTPGNRDAASQGLMNPMLTVLICCPYTCTEFASLCSQSGPQSA